MNRGAAILILSLGLLATAVASPAPGVLAARPFAPAATATATPTLTVTIRMGVRESLPAALVRGGLPADEAARAAQALANDFDTVNPHPGLPLLMSLSSPSRFLSGRPQLIRLELAPRDDERLGLSREADGALHLRRIQSPVFLTPSLTRGVVRGSLYLSIVEAGVDPAMAAKVVGLFARRLDLTRDIRSGDHFRLVFEQRRRGEDQATGGPGELLYADVATRTGAARLYLYQPPWAQEPEWVDGDGDPRRSGLLRTPVDGARVTSGFGMRLHPLLGFTRMHQGLDFGAPEGAPVLAAADGVIEEARWNGDYGRWLKIRHSPSLETGYGHLSGWAPGMIPGASVRQGQVVAYVGATGLATGPHLHYEVFKAGRRVDPRGAQGLAAWKPDPARDPDFQARRAGIDAAVAALSAQCAAPGLFPAGGAIARCVG